jgi:hypothetical protein
MRYAQLIREFIRTLIGSRYIAQLETDLIQMRAEREYFKGRAERLEMMILSRPRTPEMARGFHEPAQYPPSESQRKTLAQLQKELTDSETCAACSKTIMRPNVNYGINPDAVCKCPQPRSN